MSESAIQAAAQTTSKKAQKSTSNIEQWAETKDPYVNQLYKKLRNIAKKLNKIEDVEKKIKNQEIQAIPEQIDMVQRKDKVKAEMDEVLGYLQLYKEAFPENPAFGTVSAAKKKAAKPAEPAPIVQEVPVMQAPVVDVSKIVEDALTLIADAAIYG